MTTRNRRTYKPHSWHRPLLAFAQDDDWISFAELDRIERKRQGSPRRRP